MSDLIIGLTGGIGSGKTTVTNMFAKLAVDVIDADIIARQVVQPNSIALKAISQHFGNDYIQTDGELNRTLLRSKIFSNEADKIWLNELLHPLIRDEIISQTKAASSPYCLLVAPLLIENELYHLVNRVLVVDVKESTQLERTLKRDTSSAQEIKAIMASQTSREIRIKKAHDIINNDDDNLNQVENRVIELHQTYLTLAKTSK
jgi:dephospho-CoA kinase